MGYESSYVQSVHGVMSRQVRFLICIFTAAKVVNLNPCPSAFLPAYYLEMKMMPRRDHHLEDSMDDAEFRRGSATLYPADPPAQLASLCYPPLAYFNYIALNLLCHFAISPCLMFLALIPRYCTNSNRFSMHEIFTLND